jgi:hypothetical protein
MNEVRAEDDFGGRTMVTEMPVMKYSAADSASNQADMIGDFNKVEFGGRTEMVYSEKDFGGRTEMNLVKTQEPKKSGCNIL